MKKLRLFLHSYVPFLLCLLVGITSYDHQNFYLHIGLFFSAALVFFVRRNFGLYFLLMIAVFEMGIGARFFREWEFKKKENKIASYLRKKITLEGVLVTHPVPSSKKFSYVVNAQKILLNEEWHKVDFRVQIASVTYMAPQKGDTVKLNTTLSIPPFLEDTQKIKQIHAYGYIADDQSCLIQKEGHLLSTKIRNIIFVSAQKNLSPLSYSYFRAMVFGDQPLLGQATIERLKETGLLHLFVISGSHISFAWILGLFIFRILFSWFGIFHCRKNFFVWMESGSILFVLFFLDWINPPISSLRSVGSMSLFLFLKVLHRNQNPLWNLGVVFFAVMLFNPLYLFDLSTQLTFASVAGIFCFYQWTNKNIIQKYEMNFVCKQICKASAASLGAGFFTFPVLYFQLGVFYPISLLYNLILTPTIGALTSFLAVAGAIWPLVPWPLLHRIGFGMLDVLFEYFEKTLFWRPGIQFQIFVNPLFSVSSGLCWSVGGGLAVTAFIITHRLIKKRIF